MSLCLILHSSLCRICWPTTCSWICSSYVSVSHSSFLSVQDLLTYNLFLDLFFLCLCVSFVIPLCAGFADLQLVFGFVLLMSLCLIRHSSLCRICWPTTCSWTCSSYVSAVSFVIPRCAGFADLQLVLGFVLLMSLCLIRHSSLCRICWPTTCSWTCSSYVSVSHSSFLAVQDLLTYNLFLDLFFLCLCVSFVIPRCAGFADLQLVLGLVLLMSLCLIRHSSLCRICWPTTCFLDLFFLCLCVSFVIPRCAGFADLQLVLGFVLLMSLCLILHSSLCRICWPTACRIW